MFTLLIYLESDFLRFFTQNHDFEGWEETALSWVFAAVGMSTLVMGVMLIIKWFMKATASNINQRTWSRGKAWLFIILGLMPLLVFVSALWYFNRDFHNVIGVQGVIKSILFSSLLYILLMALVHLILPWRNDIQ
jgi:hypothetical protein